MARDDWNSITRPGMIGGTTLIVFLRGINVALNN
jgi:hypothetical protein